MYFCSKRLEFYHLIDVGDHVQGKSNNNKHLWFYLLYKELYFAQKQFEKVVYTITFYLQFYRIFEM